MFVWVKKMTLVELLQRLGPINAMPEDLGYTEWGFKD